MQSERMRQESLVCKKMDTILAAKVEADKKYESQRVELQKLRTQVISAETVDMSRKAQLNQQQQKMKREVDQAQETYAEKINQLKQENEQIKKRFQETTTQKGQ